MLFELLLHVRVSGFTSIVVLYQKFFSQSHRLMSLGWESDRIDETVARKTSTHCTP